MTGKLSEPVPFNDTSRVFNAHKQALLNSLEKTASSGRWLMAENSKHFSEEFAEFCGAEYCLPVANGTDALELALRTVLPSNNKTDAEVITVANAGGYSTTACYLVGAIPVYADIDEATQLISIDSLIRCLGPAVKAIVITHLYGAAVDVLVIKKILQENGYAHIPIIEDCAQAHGAKVASQRVGSLGDLATFSFYPTKNLGAMGDAGAVLTSNADFFGKLEKLYQYGWDIKYQVNTAFGRNSRIDELQAGVLRQLLPCLDEYNQKRKKIRTQYLECRHGSSIQFPDYRGLDFVAHLTVLKVAERDRFIDYLRRKNIAADIHYPILDCEQPAWSDMPMRFDNESRLSASKQSVKQIVSIPCFPLMTKNEVRYVCNALESWV